MYNQTHWNRTMERNMSQAVHYDTTEIIYGMRRTREILTVNLHLLLVPFYYNEPSWTSRSFQLPNFYESEYTLQDQGQKKRHKCYINLKKNKYRRILNWKKKKQAKTNHKRNSMLKCSRSSQVEVKRSQFCQRCKDVLINFKGGGVYTIRSVSMALLDKIIEMN